MTPAYVVQITTPKKFILNGLWFGPKKPKRVIIWVHGLASSAFSMSHVIGKLVDSQTAVLAFNNRGHDVVSRLSRAGKKKSLLAGGAHERFADCVDDIEGALRFARAQGQRTIFLAGHSTGCQKSIYWASKKAGRGVKGIILLAPVSDYAAALKTDKKGTLARALRYAKGQVRAGRGHELMPAAFATSWSLEDAQRFLSLYTPESPETIFSYEQPRKKPRTLLAVRRPILVLWAARDEYADRSAEEIAAWFREHIKAKNKVVIVPGVGHSFRGEDAFVSREIRAFVEAA